MISEVVLSRSQLTLCPYWTSLLRSRNSPERILLMHYVILRLVMSWAWHPVIQIVWSFGPHCIWWITQRESRFHLICAWTRLPKHVFWYRLLYRATHCMDRALIPHKFICRVVLTRAWVIISGAGVQFLMDWDFFGVFAKRWGCGVEAWAWHCHLILVQYLSHSLWFCDRMFDRRFPYQLILSIIEPRSWISLNLSRLRFSTDSHLFGITSEVINRLVESGPRLGKTLPGLRYLIWVANWRILLWRFVVELAITCLDDVSSAVASLTEIACAVLVLELVGKLESSHFLLNHFVVGVVITWTQRVGVIFSCFIWVWNRIVRTFSNSGLLGVRARTRVNFNSGFSSPMIRINRVRRTLLSSRFNFRIVKTWTWSNLVLREIFRWLTNCICRQLHSDFS